MMRNANSGPNGHFDIFVDHTRRVTTFSRPRGMADPLEGRADVASGAPYYVVDGSDGMRKSWHRQSFRHATRHEVEAVLAVNAPLAAHWEVACAGRTRFFFNHHTLSSQYLHP